METGAAYFKMILSAISFYIATAGIAFGEELLFVPARLDLSTAISIAMERNSDIAIAKRQSDFAAQRRREAIGVAFPDLDISSSYRYEGNVQEYEMAPGQSIQFQPDDNYSFSVDFNQWIYLGSAGAGLRGSKHLVAASKANMTAIKAY